MVGGFAAVAHGVTLLTQDVDVCCRLTPENLMRIQNALADLHPVHRMPPGRPPLRLTPETAAGFQNLYRETDWGQLDCLGEVLGVGSYDQVVAQSIEIELPVARAASSPSRLSSGRSRPWDGTRTARPSSSCERSRSERDSVDVKQPHCGDR